MASTTSGSSSIDWNDVTKKEGRGSNDYIPKDLAESYDGTLLRFRISEEDAESRFLRDS